MSVGNTRHPCINQVEEPNANGKTVKIYKGNLGDNKMNTLTSYISFSICVSLTQTEKWLKSAKGNLGGQQNGQVY